MKMTIKRAKVHVIVNSKCTQSLIRNAPINVKPEGGGQGIGWGFDCLCCPRGRAFDWSCSPGGGDIWIFLRPTWRYLTADSHEKDWDRTCVSRFYASRTRHTVWKDQEVMEANESKRRLSGLHCFVFKFRLFEGVFDQLNLLIYCGIKVNGSKEKPSRFLQVQLIIWLVYGSFATINDKTDFLCTLY